MFVVFEGLDGAGKSSLMRLLTERLQQHSFTVCTTREPGGTELAEKIRLLLLSRDGEAPIGRVELLLYEASRAQHVEKKIRPAMEAGQWVLCDRFTASTVAFQHYARGVDRAPVDWLNNFATAGLEPHQIILLNLPLTEAQRRTQSRGVEMDRLEAEAQDFHERVRLGYLQEAKMHPEKWLVLDAINSPEALCEQVLNDWQRQGWIR